MSQCGSFYIHWTQWTCFKLNVWASHQPWEIIFYNFFGNSLLPTILFSLFLVFPLFRWKFITEVLFFFCSHILPCFGFTFWEVSSSLSSNFPIKILFLIFIYLAAPGLSCGTRDLSVGARRILVAACRI